MKQTVLMYKNGCCVWCAFELYDCTMGVPVFAVRNRDDSSFFYERNVGRAGSKKARSNERAFLLIESLAVFYSHMGRPHTTIDANVFHF